MKKIIVLGVIASVGLTTNAIAQKKSEAKPAAIKSSVYKRTLPKGTKYINPNKGVISILFSLFIVVKNYKMFRLYCLSTEYLKLIIYL